MRWPRQRVRRARLVADGEAVWFWRPNAGAKFATTPTRRADDGGTAGPREEREISRKTIAWGMPDVSGASAVNTRVHTSLPPAHSRLRVHWAPGIPRALSDRRAFRICKARAHHAARRLRSPACCPLPVVPSLSFSNSLFFKACAACRLTVATRCYRGVMPGGHPIRKRTRSGNGKGGPKAIQGGPKGGPRAVDDPCLSSGCGHPGVM